jgi:hypothetical protein
MEAPVQAHVEVDGVRFYVMECVCSLSLGTTFTKKQLMSGPKWESAISSSYSLGDRQGIASSPDDIFPRAPVGSETHCDGAHPSRALALGGRLCALVYATGLIVVMGRGRSSDDVISAARQVARIAYAALGSLGTAGGAVRVNSLVLSTRSSILAAAATAEGPLSFAKLIARARSHQFGSGPVATSTTNAASSNPSRPTKRVRDSSGEVDVSSMTAPAEAAAASDSAHAVAVEAITAVSASSAAAMEAPPPPARLIFEPTLLPNAVVALIPKPAGASVGAEAFAKLANPSIDVAAATTRTQKSLGIVTAFEDGRIFVHGITHESIGAAAVAYFVEAVVKGRGPSAGASAAEKILTLAISPPPVSLSALAAPQPSKKPLVLRFGVGL